MKYVAIIGKTGTGYSAHLPDLPGCIAAAGTFEEARDLIQEAAAFHLEGMVEDGEQIPAPIYAVVEVEVQIPSPTAAVSQPPLRPGEATERSKWRGIMTSVAEIKQAILDLSEEEYAEIVDWFYSLEEEEWDRQFEEDVKAGRLDALAAKALEAKANGDLLPL